MKPVKLISALLLIVGKVMAQDVVYVTTLEGEIRKISANAVTGATTGSFQLVKNNIPLSAALAADNYGWLYFLRYGGNGEGEGDGKVNIYVARANGNNVSPGVPYKLVGTIDVNGASNVELRFRRLGIDGSRIAWILAKGDDGKIWLAKFACKGDTTVTPAVVTGNITLSDGSSAIFENGDLAFDASGTMYALGNDNSGNTKIYTVVPSSIATNAAAVLAYKWTLKKQSGNSVVNFTGVVNGTAFSSTGSMYICTGDGLYFIDQNTVNFAGQGTVACKLVNAETGLTDLATNYLPTSTRLPIKFKSIKAEVISKTRVRVTFDIAEASGVNVLNIQVSTDGKNFRTVAVRFPEKIAPNSEYVQDIDLK